MTPTLTPTTDEFGPQGEHVIALIGRLRNLTPEEVSSFRAAAWAAARAAAWAAAWDAATAAAAAARAAAAAAARAAAWAAAWDAAGDAAGDAAWDAAAAAARAAAWAAAGLVVRDLISTEHYDELTRVVRTTLGPIHPDDPAMTL
jgi:hypothetical protein